MLKVKLTNGTQLTMPSSTEGTEVVCIDVCDNVIRLNRFQTEQLITFLRFSNEGNKGVSA